MKFEFRTEITGARGRKFFTNVTMAKNGRINVYFPNGHDGMEIERIHGRIIADMVAKLRSIRGIGDIFIEPREVSVFMDFLTYSARWTDEIDRTVQRAAEAIYEAEYSQPKIETRYLSDRLRVFRADIELTDQGPRYFTVTHCSPRETGSYGRILGNLIVDLLSMRTVSEVSIDRNEVAVLVIHKLFDPPIWDERIDAKVKTAIKDFATQKRQEEERAQSRTVVMKTYPNSRIRGFKTPFIASHHAIHNFSRPLTVCDLNDLLEVGVDGGELVRKLMRIDGVVEVTMQPHEVSVQIGKAFEWAEYRPQGTILEQIEAAFKQVYGTATTIVRS